MKVVQEINEVKEGGYILIEGVPCKIEKVSSSVAGKHGARKYHVEAIGLFDGKRRSITKPSGENVEVPILERKRAQVLAIMGERVQLMDLSDYSVFELDLPEEIKEKVRQGEEVNYYEIMGIKTLKELK